MTVKTGKVYAGFYLGQIECRQYCLRVPTPLVGMEHTRKSFAALSRRLQETALPRACGMHQNVEEPA